LRETAEHRIWRTQTIMEEPRLMKIKARIEARPDHFEMKWQAIGSAPFDRDLELAVLDRAGVHSLVFPCRRVLRGWVNASTHSPVNVHPTHWREWDQSVSPFFARCVSS